MRQMVVVTLLAALLLSPLRSAPAASGDERSRQRQQFASAWAAVKRGADVKPLSAGLETYPLLPYLEYGALDRRLDSVDAAEVSAFIATHTDTPLARSLHTHALAAWAKAGRHTDFLALLPADGGDTPALRCQAWTARHAAQPNTLDALREAATLWRNTPKAESACAAAFAALEASGQLPPEQRLARINAAFEAGDLKLVGWLLPKLPAPLATMPTRRLKLRQHGLPALKDALAWTDDQDNRALVADALVRGAARDPKAAEVWRLKLAPHYRFTALQKQAIEEAIALAASINDLDEAAGWLKRLAVPPYAEPRLNEWATRYWLGRGKLDAAQAVLAGMPAELHAQPRWTYLHGRVLELNGAAESAKAQYQSIATDTGFFPFLAADRIGADYALCEAPFQPNATIQSDLKARGAWRRALELRELGQRGLASSELNLLLTTLDTEQRVQLAALLVKAKWYEMAITVLGAPQYQRYYSLRFPRPWGRSIDRNARLQELDPNWTSGLVRAESAFNRMARSGADARGLMQLLPGTARQLVGKKGSAPDLYNPTVNLQLGALYLRHQVDRFGGDPLATTAAYNAGPGAVQRWLPKASRQWRDLWVETIPFHETRDYVARVMAFSVVYDWRSDGHIDRLGARIGLLPPTPVKAVCPP